jgi:hypothetical protein
MERRGISEREKFIVRELGISELKRASGKRNGEADDILAIIFLFHTTGRVHVM